MITIRSELTLIARPQGKTKGAPKRVEVVFTCRKGQVGFAHINAMGSLSPGPRGPNGRFIA